MIKKQGAPSTLLRIATTLPELFFKRLFLLGSPGFIAAAMSVGLFH